MKANTRSALTPLDLCTLIAHETVSLLNADAEALDSALRLLSLIHISEPTRL